MTEKKHIGGLACERTAIKATRENRNPRETVPVCTL
jgi:hypothetical protein